MEDMGEQPMGCSIPCDPEGAANGGMTADLSEKVFL